MDLDSIALNQFESVWMPQVHSTWPYSGVKSPGQKVCDLLGNVCMCSRNMRRRTGFPDLNKCSCFLPGAPITKAYLMSLSLKSLLRAGGAGPYRGSEQPAAEPCAAANRLGSGGSRGRAAPPSLIQPPLIRPPGRFSFPAKIFRRHRGKQQRAVLIVFPS